MQEFSPDTLELHSWLRVNPRGPGRYRTEMRCAVLDLSQEKSASFDQERIVGDVLSKCLWNSRGVQSRRMEFSEFERYSLNEARKLSPMFSKQATIGRRQVGPLAHGDVVILHGYRGVGMYICYGPPDNLALIKTGSEFGYCIPIEFCDAPSAYYNSQCCVLHEFAFPNRNFLPRSASSRMKHLSDRLAAASGKLIAQLPQIKEMYFEGDSDTYPSVDEEGYFVAREESGRLSWYGGSDPALERYITESRLCDPSAEVEREDSGSSDDEDDEDFLEEEEESEVEEDAEEEDDESNNDPPERKKRERDITSEGFEARLAGATNSIRTLLSWLASNPRGSGRYRADGKCAFMAANEAKLTLSFDQLAYDSVHPHVGEQVDKAEYSFLRISLNKLAAKYPRSFASSLCVAKRGKTVVGPLQHGDVVNIPSTIYFETFVCYGPPHDLVLIKTRQDDSYCLPPEFCDAPPKYFSRADALIERAFPVPALLPKCNVPLAVKEIFVQLQLLSEKPIAPDSEYVFDNWSLWNRAVGAPPNVMPKITGDLSDEGLVIVREEDSLIMWLGPCAAATRYRIEALLDSPVQER
jgi:hypothetical protein